MTLFHRNVAVILDEVEDFLTSGGDSSNVSSLRGKRTGCDVDGILEKLNALQAQFPQIKTQLQLLKNKRDSDNSSGGSTSGGSAGGVIARSGTPTSAPAPPAKPGPKPPPIGAPKPVPLGTPKPAPLGTPKPELLQTVESIEDDIYEMLPGDMEGNVATNKATDSPALPRRGEALSKVVNNNYNSGSKASIKSSGTLNKVNDDYNYSGQSVDGRWSDVSATAALEASLFAGPLQKYRQQKGLQFGKAFKPRFCVLRDGHLLVYDKETDRKPKEVVDLSGCNVKESSTERQSFKVLGICKDHEFNAENADAKMKWMDSITAMTTALNATIEPDSSTDSGSDDKSDDESDVVAYATDEEDADNADNEDMDLSDPRYTCAYICKWDFKGVKLQQVSALRGDILDLLNKDYDKFGWWTVQSAKGKVGLLPKEWLTPAYEKMNMD